MLYIVFRYLHFLAIIAFAGAIIIENMAIKPTINGEDARNLAKVDTVYGISAFSVLAFGLILWFMVGKPSEFYTGNLLFQLKLFLFIVLALIAAYPTAFFAKHRNSEADSIAVPGIIPLLLKIEMFLLLLIPILAYLMARGIGIPS
ncbi:MAG: DUF2214 family protein [Pseudomonadales bacterium]|nr:DUF2214 family protein [Pseudomonadales bacterium]